MFWKTCLDHTIEILIFALGCGILGYLWRRWFGSSKSDSKAEEYQAQIHSLRERIKNQDAEIKSSQGLADSWKADKNDLVSQVQNLSSSLSQTRQSFEGHISPEEHRSLEARLDQDIKSTAQKLDALSAERDELASKLKSQEAKLTTASEFQSKFKEADTQWQQSKQAHEKEKSIWANQLKEAQDKENASKELSSKLQALTSKLSEVEQANQGLKLELTEKNKASIHALQSSHDSTEKLKTLELSNQAALASKEQEIKKLQTHSIELQQQMQQLQSQAKQAGDHEQALISKQNELQARIHQLEQENNIARSEANALKSKINEAESLKKTLEESDKKAKEWEARWKEVSTESEHFKLAHAQVNKEKDGHKQHIAQLESDILLAKNQLVQIHESEQQIDELKHSAKEWEKKYSDLEAAFTNARNEIEQTKTALQTNAQANNEWEKKYYDLNAQLSDAHTELEQTKRALQSNLQSNADSGRKYHDIVTQMANAEAELGQVKATLHTAQQSHSGSEARIQDLEHQLSGTITQLAESNNNFQFIKVGEDELNEKWNKSKSHADELQMQLTESKKSDGDLRSKLSGLEHAFHEVQTKANNLESNIIALNKTALQYQKEAEDLEESRIQAEEQIDKLKSDLAAATTSSTDSSSHIAEAEARYKELHSKFNTVQLQLAEAQRAKTHSDQDSKKAEDYRVKYQVEVVAWQKRVSDLEKEFANKESLQSTNYAKAMDNQRKQITILESEIDKIKSSKPVSPIVEAITSTPPAVSTPIEVKKPELISKSKVKKKVSAPSSGIAISVAKAIPTPVVAPASNLSSTSPKPQTDWKAAALAFGKKVKQDDHQIVEGIGPKIDGLLKKSKITTWVQLSNTPIRDIQTILDAGGNKFSLADPASWPSQAMLAAMGEWNELKKLQDKLNAGRVKKKKSESKSLATKPGSVSKPTKKPDSKVVKKTLAPKSVVAKDVIKKLKPRAVAPIKIMAFDAAKALQRYGTKVKQDDLKIVEGIGPKIEKLLNKANIQTWRQLGNAETKNIQAILDKAGSHFTLADPKTWAKQSLLAAESKWTSLKSMQDKLKGGK